jgi:hypothetical protein
MDMRVRSGILKMFEGKPERKGILIKGGKSLFPGAFKETFRIFQAGEP